MSRRSIRTLLPLLPLCLSAGCGTFIGEPQPGAYSGVRKDFKVVCSAPVATIDGQPAAIFFAPFFIADIPASAVADTCLLPWEIRGS